MEATSQKDKYHEAIGRRKTAAARVRISSGRSMTVNGAPLEAYFRTAEQRRVATEPFRTLSLEGKWAVSARVRGGGLGAQAEAIRHGISRALIGVQEEYRKKLKKAGFLKRDPRMKERRKFGLKKARKAPQWSKR
jgi:small subunit ribosomal protein S9